MDVVQVLAELHCRVYSHRLLDSMSMIVESDSVLARDLLDVSTKV